MGHPQLPSGVRLCGKPAFDSGEEIPLLPETMVQGDPAARVRTQAQPEIIMIAPEELSDLNLANRLLPKQKRGYRAQSHIITEKGKLVLGVRAYPENSKSPAVVGFIVLEALGEYAGLFKYKDKALQPQVYGVWKCPPAYAEINEKLRKIIPGVIPFHHYSVVSRRNVFLDGERLDAVLLFKRQHPNRRHAKKSFAA